VAPCGQQLSWGARARGRHEPEGLFFAFGGNGIVRNAIPRSLFETRPQPSVLARALSVGADEFNTFALEGVGNRPHAFDIARHPSRGGRTLECG
jgi:hypothetical protein